MKDVKDDIIKDLELKLEMSEQVKESEVQFNADLKDRIEKLELHIETLVKVNEFFRQKVLKYKSIVSKLTK
jgi:chaperonin cofactor prefoldin|tara:strand:- start:281 stop:493 length:213 start_codon:yes stop_codon:yes gene_type:complete